jgi:hypothetical protein
VSIVTARSLCAHRRMPATGTVAVVDVGIVFAFR